MCQASSLGFLVAYGFDFNKLIKEGRILFPSSIFASRWFLSLHCLWRENLRNQCQRPNSIAWMMFRSVLQVFLIWLSPTRRGCALWWLRSWNRPPLRPTITSPASLLNRKSLWRVPCKDSVAFTVLVLPWNSSLPVVDDFFFFWEVCCWSVPTIQTQCTSRCDQQRIRRLSRAQIRAFLDGKEEQLVIENSSAFQRKLIFTHGRAQCVDPRKRRLDRRRRWLLIPCSLCVFVQVFRSVFRVENERQTGTLAGGAAERAGPAAPGGQPPTGQRTAAGERRGIHSSPHQDHRIRKGGWFSSCSPT